MLLEVLRSRCMFFDVEACHASSIRPHKLVRVGRAISGWGRWGTDTDEGRFRRSHLFVLNLRGIRHADVVCG